MCLVTRNPAFCSELHLLRWKAEVETAPPLGQLGSWMSTRKKEEKPVWNNWFIHEMLMFVRVHLEMQHMNPHLHPWSRGQPPLPHTRASYLHTLSFKKNKTKNLHIHTRVYSLSKLNLFIGFRTSSQMLLACLVGNQCVSLGHAGLWNAVIFLHQCVRVGVWACHTVVASASSWPAVKMAWGL